MCLLALREISIKGTTFSNRGRLSYRVMSTQFLNSRTYCLNFSHKLSVIAWELSAYILYFRKAFMNTLNFLLPRLAFFGSDSNAY